MDVLKALNNLTIWKLPIDDKTKQKTNQKKQMKTINSELHKKQKVINSTGQIAFWKQLDRTTCEQLISRVPSIQRIIKAGNLKKICRDIEAGKWKQTGVPIILSDSGALIDGQHRVKAFLECGFYPEVLIVTNVEHDGGYKAIDIGQSRTFGDVFKANKIADYTKASSIALRLMRIEKKDLCKGSSMPLSAQDLLETYYENQDKIVYWKCRHNKLNSLISATIRAAISCYAEDYITRAAVDNFWDQVETGIGSGGAQSLRRTLIVNANKSRGRYAHDDLAFVTLLALKMHETGAGQRALKVTKHVPYFH